MEENYRLHDSREEEMGGWALSLFIPINVYSSAQEPLHGRTEQAFMSAHNHPPPRRRRHHQLHLPVNKIIQL